MSGILLGGRGRVRAYPQATVVGGGGGGGTPSGVLMYTSAKRADSVFFTPSAHWKFADGGGATASDSSANANNLTLNAPYAWVAGGAPNGVDPSLQLSNGFATTALTAEQSRDFSLYGVSTFAPTLLGWTAFFRVKPVLSASAGFQFIFRKETMPATFNVGSWAVGVFGGSGGANVGRAFLATFGGSPIVTPARVDNGVWHDIVIIKDFSRTGEYCKIYVDGVLVTTSASINASGTDQATHQLILRNEATGGEQPEVAEAAFLPFAIPTTVPALLWNGGGGAQRRLNDLNTGLVEIAKV